MKLIFVAAGKGTRLAPLTNDRPKALVPYNGKPLLRYNLESARSLGLTDISVVTGYKAGHFDIEDVKIYHNPDFGATNMVHSFMQAKPEFDDDIILSYSDIIYAPAVLEKLMEADADIAVVVDRRWKELWTLRMEDPLKDAETLKISDKGHIVEIGKKTDRISEIQGQYIGLIKFSKHVIPGVVRFYEGLDKTGRYDEQDYGNMYMTSLIQLLIDKGVAVEPVFIDGNWMEFDTLTDIEAYQQHRLRYGLDD